MSSPSADAPPHSSDLPRRIGTAGAMAVMVGIIIGSGIFNTPTVAARNFGSPTTILWMWVAGGVLALFGALTYSELTTRFPRSGGLYVFLREGFGRAGAPLAFTFGWTYMLITKPFAAAGIMVPGAEHLLRLAGVVPSGPDDSRFEFIKLALTSVLLVFFTGVNVPGVKAGTRLAMALTSLKFGVLAALVVVAALLRKGDPANFAPVVRDVPLITAIGVVMAAILWTYDGWADVGSIAGEVKQPRRTLPLVFIGGTLATIAIYLLVNAVFIWMLPLDEMATTDTVAPAVATRLVGEMGGIVVTAAAAMTMLGSSHASIITGARVTFAQARDGLLFRSLGTIHKTYHTPATALWVQCALSLVAVWTQKRFENLATGFTFTMWIFYGLAGVSLLLIRSRDRAVVDAAPGSRRAVTVGGASGERLSSSKGQVSPFRCPGYPVVPLLFVTSAIAMTTLLVVGKPSLLWWLLLLAAGWPVYYLWRWWVPSATIVEGEAP